MGWVNTWIASMQIFFISAGAASFAIGISITLPKAVNQILQIWSLILPCLRPTILINCIIIAIAAASHFRQTPVPSHAAFPPPTTETEAEAFDDEDRVVELKPVVINGLLVDLEEEESGGSEEDEDAFFDRTSSYDPVLSERSTPEFQAEHMSPEPILDSPKREKVIEHETLENTWKKIMEGASQVQPNKLSGLSKSKIQKEGSPSQDELNGRVEAFIKKVNHEIRLQRLQPLDHYMDIENP